jgi:hypothetical protein
MAPSFPSELESGEGARTGLLTRANSATFPKSAQSRLQW